MNAINTHINNAGICYTGCGALCNMTGNNGNGYNTNEISTHQIKVKWTDENQAIAAMTGGIEAVIKAVSIHVDNAGVCYVGCGALTNIAANYGKAQQQQQQNINEMNR